MSKFSVSYWIDKLYYELTGLRITKRGERVAAGLAFGALIGSFFLVGTIESKPL